MDPYGPVPSTIAPFSLPRGEITPRMIQALQDAGPWTRFLAIVQLFLASLNALSAVGLLVARELGLMGLILAGLYTGTATVYTLWGISLLRFAGAAGRAASGGREAAIERALGHARDFWQRVGIATLAGFCLTLLGVILLLSSGMGSDPQRARKKRLQEVQQVVPSWWRSSSLPALTDLSEACNGQDTSFLCIHEGVADEDGDLESGREKTMLRGTVSTFVPRREGWDGTRVEVTDGQVVWEVSFVPPPGHALLPGLYIGAADPAPPELARIGLARRGGRSCETSDGRFQIHEIAWDAAGKIRRLTVDFEATCPEGEKAWKAVGRLQLALPETGRG